MAQPQTALNAGKKLILTQTDLAKYPFIPQAAEHVRGLEHSITTLEGPEYAEILERAEQRIKEAIEKKLVGFQRGKDETEILSFPIAVMMAAYTNDPSLKKRYALAEANRIYALLKEDEEQKLVDIAMFFNWKIKRENIYTKNLQASTSGFSIDFASYLRNARIFHESEWKLINRPMRHGEVYLTKEKVARLLAEEVKVYIEKKLFEKIDFVLSKPITERVEKLRHLYASLRGKIREEETPTETVIDAFPPCIKRLHNTALAKQHLSHIERFTLTSFLLNSGMTVENVIECFRPTSDFSEKMTRYQVEHIAGGRGSRTKYVPPRCDTLQTHGVCPGMDDTCRRRVKHPLHYYRRKLRTIKTGTTSTHPKRE